LGGVVPQKDILRRTQFGGVLSSFVYIPKGVRCPWNIDLLSRLRDEHRAVRADPDHCFEDGAHVSYLEAAPRRCATRIKQLHAAAVVELVAG
jgi:Fe-S cluster assembly scaffold protein SufB